MNKQYVELGLLLEWIYGMEEDFNAVDLHILKSKLNKSAVSLSPPDPPDHGPHIDARKLQDWLCSQTEVKGNPFLEDDLYRAFRSGGIRAFKLVNMQISDAIDEQK